MTSLLMIAWIYFRIGVIFVGGGYVLIPLLKHIMVDQYGWLTLRQFLDGLALSQLTPGPLAMLATFTGFRAGGLTGGLVATRLHLPALHRSHADYRPQLRPPEKHRSHPQHPGRTAAGGGWAGGSSGLEPGSLIDLRFTGVI